MDVKKTSKLEFKKTLVFFNYFNTLRTQYFNTMDVKKTSKLEFKKTLVFFNYFNTFDSIILIHIGSKKQVN